MNYLAHLFLSKRTPDSFTGNLMGDFKRQLNASVLSPEIALGIENHRFVDKVTDANTEIKDLKKIFSKERRRYSGVVLDIVFDYYLIKHWHRYEVMPFKQFTQLSYEGLLANVELMPERMQFVVQKMHEHSWLESYSTLDGIGQTIDQVSRRIRFKNQMAGAIEEIKQHDEVIDAVFCEFFPILLREVELANIEGS